MQKLDILAIPPYYVNVFAYFLNNCQITITFLDKNTTFVARFSFLRTYYYFNVYAMYM